MTGRFSALLALALWTLSAVAASNAVAFAPARPQLPAAPALPLEAAVPGFDAATDSIAFLNYAFWDHSRLPFFLQVAHCSGMALLARQVHNWAIFDPSQPRLSTAGYENLLRTIFNVDTTVIPGPGYGRYVIPGYANLYQMTSEPAIQEAVKNVLGDALNDALRPNWNWEPLDVYGSTPSSRDAIELRHRATIASGKPSLTYLTQGTQVAHAILLYAYRVEPDRVIYTAYDSNHPGEAYEVPFLLGEGRFDHPDWGRRDPWVLHPYSDERDGSVLYHVGRADLDPIGW